MAFNTENAREPAPGEEGTPRRGAFSIAEWCHYRGICPATFYNRRRFGEMPAVLKIGRRTLITAEADAEWRRRMETACVTDMPKLRRPR